MGGMNLTMTGEQRKYCARAVYDNMTEDEKKKLRRQVEDRMRKDSEAVFEAAFATGLLK